MKYWPYVTIGFVIGAGLGALFGAGTFGSMLFGILIGSVACLCAQMDDEAVNKKDG